MKLNELDQQFDQSLDEGPLSWAFNSSRVGQWWNSRKGKAQQQQVAELLINSFSKWRGYTGVKEVTPAALAAWMTTGNAQGGLGITADQSKQLIRASAKTVFGPGVGGKTPLNGSQIKNFVVAISRDQNLLNAVLGTDDQQDTTGLDQKPAQQTKDAEAAMAKAQAARAQQAGGQGARAGASLAS